MNIYEYQRLVGKIDDIPELKDEFITIYDVKSHKQVVQFCISLGEHLIELTGFSPVDEIAASFEAMKKWMNGEVNYHEARNLSLQISRIARDEKDIVKVRFLRTMAQIVASPHVKYHGLWVKGVTIPRFKRSQTEDKVCTEKKCRLFLLL